jgi:hypothetical protein
MPRDRTAQTEPLTIGQKLVARWESIDSGWSEPADLAEAIDNAIEAETVACAVIAEQSGCGAPGCTDCHGGAIAAAIRNRAPAHKD